MPPDPPSACSFAAPPASSPSHLSIRIIVAAHRRPRLRGMPSAKADVCSPGVCVCVRTAALEWVKRSLFHRTAPIRRAAQDVGAVWLQQVRATRGLPLVAPVEPAFLPPIDKMEAAAAAAAADAADAEVLAVNLRAEESARSLRRREPRPTPLHTEGGGKWSITEMDDTLPAVCSPSSVRIGSSALTMRAIRPPAHASPWLLSQRRSTDERTGFGTSTVRFSTVHRSGFKTAHGGARRRPSGSSTRHRHHPRGTPRAAPRFAATRGWWVGCARPLPLTTIGCRVCTMVNSTSSGC